MERTHSFPWHTEILYTQEDQLIFKSITSVTENVHEVARPGQELTGPDLRRLANTDCVTVALT